MAGWLTTITARVCLNMLQAARPLARLLGPNDADKTTTVRMLACLIGPASGDARIAGLRITGTRDARKIRGLTGLLPEEPGLYPDLSAARTLDFFGRLYQVPAGLRAERTERLLTMLDLWDRRDAPDGRSPRA